MHSLSHTHSHSHSHSLTQLNPIRLPKPFPYPYLPNPPFRNPPRFRKKRLFLRNALDFPNWIPPAVIGFASGLAISLSSLKNTNPAATDDNSPFPAPHNAGEWILFTTPTPFNRFVLLRCPSVAFHRDGEALESVNYVRVDFDDVEGDVAGEYQRVCVGTEDGGVISLDYPAELELSQDRGLDTTVLIVAGTPEGSLEESVREFVRVCLKRGLFPVVINPRGCANSPLTTPRLFTAADSDDICSAIQFITRARPWSALTGVGWGYGANMLTKYLAEAGEKTPLTAATCIDNPFDLNEATRISPYNTTIDKRLTRGLIDILKSNKGLFQGKRKGFDLEMALAAESIRDFDTAISMVSHGFESVEDFYASCSTRSLIGNLKIPVLFIQNDDGIAPVLSLPRALIAENPFTSLLLCCCAPSKVTAISWYQKVTIEWLAAVELGLLKGRHPLLQDIDVTVNPSKSLALMDGRSPDTNSRHQSPLNPAELNGSDPNADLVKKVLTESPAAASADLHYLPHSRGKQGPDYCDLTEMNTTLTSNHSVDANSAEITGTTPVESDTGQVLQTTQVVMNMLDVTMPGTLKEEEKRKVVQAVSQGETLINALQAAVPEDVRGKLTTSVSEILQARGNNLNLDRLLSINRVANISSGSKSEMQENVSQQPNTTTESKGHSSGDGDSKSDPKSKNSSNQNDDMGVSGLESPAGQPLGDKDSESDQRSKNISNQNDDMGISGGESPAGQPSQKSPKSSDILASDSASSHGDDSVLEKGSINSQNSDDKHDGDVSEEKAGQLIGDPPASNPTPPQPTDATISSNGVDNIKEQDSKETSMPTQIENSKDLSQEQDASSSSDIGSDQKNEAQASANSEGKQLEKDDENINKDEKTVQAMPDQDRVSDAKSPSFDVTQAFDALTGLDDSTQVAVNSVFGVLEGMISQLEEKKNEDKTPKGSDDALCSSALEKNCVTDELQLEKQTDGKDQEHAKHPDIELVNGNYSDKYNNVEAASNANHMKMNLVATTKGGKCADVYQISSNLTTNPTTKALYKEYLQNYIISKLHNGLYLHYVPEKGHWILLENPKGTRDASTYNSKDRMDIDKLLGNEDGIIEPSYVILDKDGRGDTSEELESKETLNCRDVDPNSKLDYSKTSVKTILLGSLKVEVSRRLTVTDLEDIEPHLAADMEKVAEAICLAIKYDEVQSHQASIPSVSDDVLESSSLNKDELIVETISKAVQDTSHLKRVLPVGVVVGSSLAALRNFRDSFAAVDCDATRILDLSRAHHNLMEAKDQPQPKDDMQVPFEGKISGPSFPKDPRNVEESLTLNSLNEVNGSNAQSNLLSKDNLMVGAVTAALGASAFLTTQQEGFMESVSNGASSNLEETLVEKDSSKLEEAEDNKHQNNIVTSLAEKAMTVAAPVVPTKEDGEVDHERLVATLAELGQRGGVLRLVGKLALLWGGLRGAISLTDRLLSFLRLAERPLVQRILGFLCMVLVLWSPVLVPLLPTLFQNMATHNSSKIVELACIVGLYTAVTILITHWGKRIRGYKYPLKQYGLDFMSSRKMQDFVAGLTGGVVLVLCIHSVNALLGFVSFSLPTNLSSSSFDLIAKLKAYGQLLLLASRGLVMAIGVTFVEELLFRSWLLEEIAVDLGYHPAIILSGLAFALSQRSILAIPGHWLLSVCLAGARLRKEGSLFIPIGLRTGILSSSFILQTGGFLICRPLSQFWVAGMHPLQPFNGVVGILSALLLAVALYPRQRGLQTIRA